MPAYRLLFNLLAVILILPPVYLLYTTEWAWLWRWSGPAWWLANGLALLAVGLFFWTLSYYDSGEFIGIRQWRQRLRRVEDQERFHISPLHRFVRHPWYFLGLVLIWTRDMNVGLFMSALVTSLYLLIGSRFEEQKLGYYHGQVYARYRERVPGLIPNPWRFLTRRQAEELLADDRDDGNQHD